MANKKGIDILCEPFKLAGYTNLEACHRADGSSPRACRYFLAFVDENLCLYKANANKPLESSLKKIDEKPTRSEC
jgi:hypothetical protein